MVEVEEVERSVRCVVEVDGAEALVGGGEEFFVFEWVSSGDF